VPDSFAKAVDTRQILMSDSYDDYLLITAREK